MFEDFKEKVGKLQKKNDRDIPSISTTLAPDIIEKLRKAGIDPDNVTIQQLFPETLDEDGNDLSLMSGAEWEIMITYAKTRKYLLEKYPQSHEEAKMLGQPWKKIRKNPVRLTSKRHKTTLKGKSSFTLYSKYMRSITK